MVSADSRPFLGGLELCGHCRNKEARYSYKDSILTPPIHSRMEAVRNPKRTIFKRQTTTSEPTLTSDLRPDDLPQVDGYCCGHAYLKLSDGQRCVCLCVQCRDLNCDGGLKRGFKRSFKVKSRKSVKNAEAAAVDKDLNSHSEGAPVSGVVKTNTCSTTVVTGGAASCGGGPLENKVKILKKAVSDLQG